MRFVEHRCPNCQATAVVPIVAIEPGDAGVWQCDACDSAYEIEIRFHRVAPEMLEKRRREFVANFPLSGSVADDETEGTELTQAEQNQLRLLEIQQDIRRLNELVEELDAEGDRLRDESNEQ